MKSSQIGYFAILGCALLACGDDAKQGPADAAEPPVDSTNPGMPGYTPPTAVRIDLSDTGPDQLHSVATGPAGSFYLAGYKTTGPAPDLPRTVVVVKINNNGTPDNDFGVDAEALIPGLVFVGANDEIDLVVQEDGKLLVSATVPAKPANPLDAADRDIGVARLLPTGAPDATFGDAGVVVVNLNEGKVATPATYDAARSITVNDAGIFVHAQSRGLGEVGGMPRSDIDFTVVKLSLVNGAVDTTFGDQSAAGRPGQYRLDIDGTDAAARGIRAVAGGKLLAGGYSTTPRTNNKAMPVIYRLTPQGVLDETFANLGVFHSLILGQQTEVYGFAIHPDGKFVTGGYGRETEMPNINNYISLRFDLENGMRDEAWGGAPKGAVVFDPSGMNLTSNCRGAYALPGGKTLLIGSSGQNNTMAQDATFAILDATGKLDTSYGPGIHKYKLGSDGFDQFWGAAVSGNKVGIVGWKGVGPANAQTATSNDDSFGILLDLK